MWKNPIILIVTLLYTSLALSQQSHILVLEKKNWSQAYKVSSNFPGDWINTMFQQGYNARTINFKNNEWLITVVKYKETAKQIFLTNPSIQQLDDKARDGYKIRDICLYPKENKLNRLYLMYKASVNPVFNSFAVRKPNNNTTISKIVKKSWQNGKLCKNIKSVKNNNNIEFVVLNAYESNRKYEQLIEFRIDFPFDLIENKKSQGFILTSITYDNYKKSWCTIMTKKKRVRVRNGTGNIWSWEEPPKREWIWFDYKSQKSEISNYIENKGYVIVNVN
jgi:hypothetical protein